VRAHWQNFTLPQKEFRMCRFSHQISFTSAAWRALMEDASDPLAPVRSPIESLGGKLVSAYVTKDSYDVLALSEFPDTVSPDDISIAFYSGGMVATVHSSPLMSIAQAHEARRRVGSPPYRGAARAQTA
jgi:uncharacterized protein with GYD domain